ncbi:MAG: tryptophan 7-halogenase, partial [Myxococcales bacterium]|nr:tryptophan 7-halogenase [Myxococcales bacterium]
AAAFLAKRGIDALVLERASFPRFRIGESLLSCNEPVFERLGFAPTTDEHVRKRGAVFVDDQDGRRTQFGFADALPGTPAGAWNVERGAFDRALLEHAARCGATVEHGRRAQAVNFTQQTVQIETDAGTVQARYVIDATGPSAVLGRQFRSIEPIRGFGIASVYAHWEHVDEGTYARLTAGGEVTIVIEPFGWGWVIPLAGRRLSIGFVTREKGFDAARYRHTVQHSRVISPLVRGATSSDPTTVGNFSFVNRAAYGARYACVGDAGTFLDPVFSSGVSLGMLGAELVAEHVAAALRSDDEADPHLLATVRARMRLAYESFGALIHRFYHTRIIDHLFLHPDPEPLLRAGLVSILAGDVWRSDNSFQTALLTGRNPWSLDAPNGSS